MADLGLFVVVVRSVPFALVVLLLTACGGSSDESADTTCVTTTTTEATTTTTVTRLVDEWTAGSNSYDIDAIVAVLADGFYVKLCPQCAERTDRASLARAVGAMSPINFQVVRTTDLQPTSGSAYLFQATICTAEDGHIADIEVESGGIKITRLVTVAWEKHDCP